MSPPTSPEVLAIEIIEKLNELLEERQLGEAIGILFDTQVRLIAKTIDFDADIELGFVADGNGGYHKIGYLNVLNALMTRIDDGGQFNGRGRIAVLRDETGVITEFVLTGSPQHLEQIRRGGE